MTYQCPAFHGIINLRGMKTQRRHIPRLQHRPPVHLHPERMRRVINHLQPILVRHRLNPLRVARLSVHMHRHNRRRLRRNRRLNLLRVDIARLRVDIHKHRLNPVPPQRMRRRHKAVRRRYHLPRHLQRLQRRQQRQRPVREQTHVRHLQILPQRFLQQLVIMPVVRQPLPLPNIPQIRYKIIQFRQQRTRHRNLLFRIHIIFF